jgi:hypothetical protein
MATSLLIEGFWLMRERLTVYALFGLACAAAAWEVMPHLDLYDVIANHPMALFSTPPVSVVLVLALVALFFILPSAMRRIDPSFHMTGMRIALTAATLACVGLVTEIGYVFAVIPGIVAAVLLSQALVGALLRVRAGSGLLDVVPLMIGSMRGSIAMTRTHFVTTFGVVAASLVILLVPFTLVMLTLLILGVRVPPSLVVTTPALFFTFIYFECVRYSLIVRWYRRLAKDAPDVALAA